MQVQTARERYTACPLCEAPEFVPIVESDCTRHPLYGPEIPPKMQWVGCIRCGHMFTDGYFTSEVFENLMQRVQPHSISVEDVEPARVASAAIVDNVANVLETLEGRWLDVGFGSGVLLATANEFGFETVGIDSCEQSVKDLHGLGYDVRCQDFQAMEDDKGFDVISMADVLEHMPFPGEALKRARALMPRGGALFISMPNTDCLTWKLLDRDGKNPYWSELEHYHNFGREHLYWLLERHGFKPCYYAVSTRDRAAMEVIATC